MIKIKYGYKQKEERYRIINQMIKIGVNERGCDNAWQSRDPAWEDAKIEKIEVIGNFNELDQPNHQKKKCWWNKAKCETPVFNIIFFGQKKSNNEQGTPNNELRRSSSLQFIIHHSLLGVRYSIDYESAFLNLFSFRP